jgi:hypothetical protein
VTTPEPGYVIAITGRRETEFVARRSQADLLVVGTLEEAVRFRDRDEAEVLAQEIRREQVGDLFRVAVLPTYVPPSLALHKPAWWRRVLLRIGL